MPRTAEPEAAPSTRPKNRKQCQENPPTERFAFQRRQSEKKVNAESGDYSGHDVTGETLNRARLLQKSDRNKTEDRPEWEDGIIIAPRWHHFIEPRRWRASQP